MKRELATSQLSFSQTKEEIYSFANAVVSEVKGGMINALDVLIMFKKIDKAFEVIKPQLQEMFIDEGDKFNKQVYKGATVDIKNAPAKWEYNDQVLADLKNQLTLTKALIKNRQSVLQIGITPEGEQLEQAVKVEQGRQISVTFK